MRATVSAIMEHDIAIQPGKLRSHPMLGISQCTRNRVTAKVLSACSAERFLRKSRCTHLGDRGSESVRVVLVH